MRVLHVVAYFPPDRMGGVGEVVAHLHRSLLAAGHHSVVWTSGRGAQDPRVQRIHTGALGFVLGLPLRLRALGEFDVLHCHHGDALLLLLAQRLRSFRIPVLVTYHVGHREMALAWRPYSLCGRRFGTGLSGFAYRHVTARWHRIADALMRSLADRVCFISASTARDLLGSGPARGARVVYNAVPLPARERPEACPVPVDLLYVGTGGARKRVHALPEILRRVRATRPAARLRIVGLARDDAPELTRHFEELGLGAAVSFEGRLASEELPPFYRAAGVLVVPSIYEGLPMVVLEAMACGLPCVATRVSGHPEAIEEDVSGLLVAPDDPPALAAACLRLLGDPELRARFAAAARARVSARFGLERQRDAYLALYQELMSQRAGRA